jgi:hypothetical protein
MRRTAAVALAALAVLAAALAVPPLAAAAGPSPTLSTAEAPWPRPDEPLARARAAGLKSAKTELLDYHVHAHLDVFVDGEKITVPAGIGISDEIPERETTDGVRFYGLSGLPRCKQPCISPLHTHTDSGILHTESPVDRLNTLGEFFTEWGVRFTKRCIGGYCTSATKLAVYIDGKKTTGNWRSIKLENEREIAVVIGTPPDKIPKTADFTQA